MKQQVLSYITIVLLISVLVQYSGASRVQADNGSTKIGFVNISTIFNQYKKAKEEKEKVRQHYQQETLEIKKLEEEAQQIREKIPLYRVGSNIRRKLEQDLAEIVFKARNLSERAKYFMAEKLRTGTEEVYQDIIKAVDEYAAKNGFSAVFKVEEADFFGAQSPNDVKDKIDMRGVLYWGKTIDITEQIVAKLNK